MEGEEGHRFRNHPTILVSNTVTAIVLLVVVWLAMSGESDQQTSEVIGLGILAVFVVVELWMVFWWRRTIYIFTRNELHVTRNAVFKVDKHIQYTRLASITIRRDVFNRIFGTSTLMFNVNSSINASTAEATLVLKKAEADRLRERLNQLIFSNETTLEEDRQIQTLSRVTNRDIIAHAVLAQPTYQAIFGFLMLVYAVISLFYSNSGGFLTAALLFAVTEILPFISIIMKYYNYRIYRVNDTVVVESGLITTTRHSFKINKINSVRIREPLLARLLGRATLEAEVIGMADGDNTSTPILCPMKRRADVMALFAELVPEYIMEPEAEHQPRRALAPMVIADTIYAVVIVAMCIVLFVFAETYLVGESESLKAIVRATELVAAVALPLMIYCHSGLAQRHRTFDMGESTFMFVYGGYDLSTEFINYDKVQFVEVTSGPLQRRFDVATCTVSMMSSVGFKQVRSGLFDPEDLEKVTDEVVTRVKDGRYDYKKYL